MIQFNAPILTIKAYAELTKQTPKAVQGQVEHGILPFVQPKGKGGLVFINMEALKMLAIEAHQNAQPHNKVNW